MQSFPVEIIAESLVQLAFVMEVSWNIKIHVTFLFIFP